MVLAAAGLARLAKTIRSQKKMMLKKILTLGKSAPRIQFPQSWAMPSESWSVSFLKMCSMGLT